MSINEILRSDWCCDSIYIDVVTQMLYMIVTRPSCFAHGYGCASVVTDMV